MIVIFFLLSVLCAEAKLPVMTTSFVTRYPFAGKVEEGFSRTGRVPLRPPFQPPLVKTFQTPLNKGGMSTRASAVSLTKNIIGAGILALPGGMACGAGTGQITASLMAVICCLLSTFSFNLVGRAVHATGARDFRELWADTIGAHSAWVVNFFIFAESCGSLLVYSCFLGDILKSLLMTTRTNAVLVSSALLVPLVLLKDLSALAPLAYTGIAAVVYTTWFIMQRSLRVDASFPFPPQLAQISLTRLSMGSFLLFNMLSTAFMAHTNAVRFYNEMRDRSLENFKKVSVVGFFSSTVFFIAVMLAGYRTFGAASQGLILNNYATSDVLGQVARVATAVSILAGYPLVFTSLRDVSISSLKTHVPQVSDPSSFAWRLLTLGMLSLITVLAAATSDVRLLVSLCGSLFGAAMIYCVPSAIFLKAAARHTHLVTTQREVFMVRLLFVFGVLSAAIGTTVTCISAFSDILK